MPNSTKGAKKCGKASRFGATFKVFLTKGKTRISCKRARQIVRKKPLDPIKHYQYFDLDQGRQRAVVRRVLPARPQGRSSARSCRATEPRAP
jgi:hypothetical protein